MAISTTRLIHLHTNPYFKFQALIFTQISKQTQASCFLANHSHHIISATERDTSLLPGAPLPSGSPSNCWKSWILGAGITGSFSFFRDTWGSTLFQITEEVEVAVETADHVAELIETLAEEMEKVAFEVGDELPEGGKLKGAFEFIENVARKNANGAHLTDEILDKVAEVEKEVGEIMEPVNHKANSIAE